MNNIKNRLFRVSDLAKITNWPTALLNSVNISEFQTSFIHKSCLYEITNPKADEPLEDFRGLNIFENFSREMFSKTNERLEFLGDSILEAVVKEYLYDRFSTSDEGFLTRLKIKLVKSETCIFFAKKLDFKDFLVISNKMENQTSIDKGRNNNRLLEDCFEAFIGVMFKEAGFERTKEFIVNLIESFMDLSELIYGNDNFKDSLLRLFQSRKWSDPKYTDLVGTDEKLFTKIIHLNSSLMDPDSRELIKKSVYKIFPRDWDMIKTIVPRGNILISLGKGKTKKEAEQMAAKNALVNLQVVLNF